MATDKVTFNIHTVVLFQGKTWDYDVEFNEDCCTLDDVMTDIERQFEYDIDKGIIIDDTLGEPLDSFYTEITEDMCSFDLAIFPEYVKREWDSIEKFANIYYNSSWSLDVFDSANDCGIDFDEIDDRYRGKYDDDEDFTMNLLDEMGDLPDLLNKASYIHIDWERTAREIMYDYVESNGHYFLGI
jgi:antirestriction protein